MIHGYSERQLGSGETTQRSSKALCGSCKELFSIRLYVHLSANDPDHFKALAKGLSSLNPIKCPSCTWSSYATAPVCVHLPGERRIIFAIPEYDRYRVLEVQAQMSFLLSGRAHIKSAPYLASPELAVGDDDLARLLVTDPQERSQRNDLRSSNQSKTQVTPLPLSLDIHPSEEKIDSLDALLDAALDQSPTGIFDMTTKTPEPVQLSQKGVGETEPQEFKSIKSLSEGHFLPPKTNILVSPSPITPLPTNLSVKVTPFPQSVDKVDEESPTQLLYSKNIRRFDQEYASGSLTYLKITSDTIEAAAQVDERQAEGWISQDLETRIQLHMIDDACAPCLTLFTMIDGEIEDELSWPIEVNGTIGPQALRLLRSKFRFELTLYKKTGSFYGQRVIETPLEENAAYILKRIKKLKMTSKQASQATLKLREEGFDHVGRMQHHFVKDSFTEIEDAASAKLAVGIWSYWSIEEQRDYLLLIKSFPLSWLRRIQHRILRAGVEYGIYMPPHLQSQAIAFRLAKNDVDLIQKTISHFVEVNVQLKPSGLTAEEVWENWDGLLNQVESLGILVDEEVELLALQAMQRVGIQLEDEYTYDAESIEYQDISVDEASSPNGLEPSSNSTSESALEFIDLSADDMIEEVDELEIIEELDIDFLEADQTSVNALKNTDEDVFSSQENTHESLMDEDLVASFDGIELIDEAMIEEELIEEEFIDEAMIEEELIEEAMIEEELIEEELIEEELIEEELIEEELIEEELIEEELIEEELIEEELIEEELIEERDIEIQDTTEEKDHPLSAHKNEVKNSIAPSKSKRKKSKKTPSKKRASKNDHQSKDASGEA